jgi:hypothetical protein
MEIWLVFVDNECVANSVETFKKKKEEYWLQLLCGKSIDILLGNV